MSGITCPDCLSGSIKYGEPSGTVTTIQGLPEYVTRPTGTPKGLIVLIPDIFGWEISNCRLLADAYAKEGGFLVYLPNFMNGFIPSAGAMHAMELFLAPSPSIFTTIFNKPFWLLRHCGKDPETNTLKIGSAGFCWGGKYTILLSQQPDLIDAAFTAHPSKMKVPEAWDKVQKPLSVAIGDVDTGIKIDMAKDVKTLLEGESKPKGQNEVVIYAGAKHGFAARADRKDEGQTKSAGEAFQQAIAWFTKWMI
ncbi:dienelactone hydrolase family protein [Stipitochalara longipes BDJ]|nr:dienelactone hydrolase family protein [Stipitochalara longipes BDJ]